MQIQCIECGTPLKSGDINIKAALAACPNCGTVFSLTDDDPYGQLDMQDDDRMAAAIVENAMEVTLPSNMTATVEGDRLRIGYWWFTPAAIPGTIFMIVWALILFGWFGPFNVGVFIIGFPFGLFPLLFLGAGVWGLLNTLPHIINYTRILVTQDAITVLDMPIPTRRTFDVGLPVNEVEQLFVMSRVARTQVFYTNMYQGHYDVVVRMSDGRDRTLMRGLKSAEHALYIEQEIERYLRIKDVPVVGEYKTRARVGGRKGYDDFSDDHGETPNRQERRR